MTSLPPAQVLQLPFVQGWSMWPEPMQTRAGKLEHGASWPLGLACDFGNKTFAEITGQETCSHLLN